MQLFRQKDLIDKARKLHGEALKTGDKEKQREVGRILNALYNQNMDDPNIMYHLGTWQMEQGNTGVGAVLLHLCTEKAPEFTHAWNNLGICFKMQFKKEQAAYCFHKAIELKPDFADAYSNWAGCYVNEGEPERALLLADKSLEIRDHAQGRWHKALALLEMQNFREGWDFHEARLDELHGCGTAIRNYAEEGMTPWWDGKSQGLIAIHGEQGLGDEIMFSSCIFDAVEKNPDSEFVFECAPRMEALFQRSLPCKVIGTHRLDGSEWREGRKVDYKVAMGSLPKFYRRSVESFPGKPFLKPNPKKARYWRKMLGQLGLKPKIGIAWQGGAVTTRIDLRSVHLNQLLPILSQEADFISLQYTKSAHDEIEEFSKEHKIPIRHWQTGHNGDTFKDMDEFGALVSELDLIISVCQTAIHMGGAMGTPVWCLTPKAPAWRYGVTGNMPWYDSVNLYRQGKEETWEPVVNRVSEQLEKFIAERKAA